MRACRSLLIVLVVAVLSLLGAGSATAGGPTSVLLVVPGSGQSASLYHSDTDYELLSAVLGASGERPIEADTSGSGHDVGRSVNVTWLIHDVQVWRVDQVYPEAPGGPWIATRQVLGAAESIWGSPVVWHRATEIGLLESLLGRLGVMPGEDASPVAVEPPVTADLPVAAEPPSDAGPPTRSAPAGSGDLSTSGWLWGLGGVALGVAAASTARRAVLARARRRGTADRTPPTAIDVDDWAPDDELASHRQP